MKRILLYSFSLFLIQNLNAQTQIGSNITGGVAGARFGHTVSLNSAGTKVAVGAPFKSTPNTINGFAQVYNDVSNSWVQNGATINGESAQDNFGRLALSGDGNTLVVGGSTNDGNGTDSGHVRVFTWNGSAWVQKGVDINGEAAGDNFGVNVSLSNDGTILAVGSHLSDSNGVDSGQVRVFSWNGTSWLQRGVNLNGEAAGDEFGANLRISLDGTKLIVGGRKNDGNGTDSGHVRVFNWNGTAWVQLGLDIEGSSAGDLFGNSVAISNSGTRIVVGAPSADAPNSNSGHVKIFNYNGSVWEQLGSDISESQADANFGNSVSINGSGDAVFIGGPGFDSVSSYNVGVARYFKWNGAAWQQIGTNIMGSIADQLGYSVSLSNDGNIAAVGIPFESNGGNVKVYNFTALLSSTDFQLNDNFSVYPNPTKNQFQLSTEISIDKVEVLNLQGQVIKTFESQDSYNVNDLSAGIYLVMIHSEEGKGIKKIIKN